MAKPVWLKSPAILAFAVLALGLLSARYPAQAQGFQISPVVLTGQFAPGTNGGRFSTFSFPSINASGAIAFQANISGGSTKSAIFVSSPRGGISPVVLQGQAAPGTGGKEFFGFSEPVLNDDGAVAFRAKIGVEIGNEGVFLFSNGSTSAIAITGQLAPGTGGQRFTGFSVPDLNDSGAVAFQGRLGDSSGIFLFSNGAVAPIALTGQTAPGTNGGRFSDIGAFSFSDSGDIAFAALLNGGSARNGIFLFSNGAIQPIVLQGQAVPGAGGESFAILGNPKLNAGRAVAFTNSVAGGGIFPNLRLTGVFLAIDGTIMPIAQHGRASTAPISGLLSLGKFNDLAFVGRTTTGPGQSTAGIFLASGARILTVVLEGQAAPGTGGVFSFASAPSIRDGNSMVFVSRISGGSADVGIFLAKRSG